MAEIRRSYLQLAREAHPDYHTDNDAARVAAEERMREINAAWAVLGDVDARSAYDRERLSGTTRPKFHAGSHGNVDEPDPWKPFDDGDPDGFDDRDDRPITNSALPSWLKTAPALGVLFGIAFALVGSLVNLMALVQIGMSLLIISVLLFMAAPIVALSMSRSGDRAP